MSLQAMIERKKMELVEACRHLDAKRSCGPIKFPNLVEDEKQVACVKKELDVLLSMHREEIRHISKSNRKRRLKC